MKQKTIEKYLTRLLKNNRKTNSIFIFNRRPEYLRILSSSDERFRFKGYNIQVQANDFGIDIYKSKIVRYPTLKKYLFRKTLSKLNNGII